MGVGVTIPSRAHAVDALDDVERARFERHVTRCADCRAEVTSLCRGVPVVVDRLVEAAASVDLILFLGWLPQS
ncbi:MAG TPA: zf-HC2 domain-containing protein [Segeticoccus sp.]|uniref:zf-HC2 domain-containing protein n=1 Tax=Segeticoccus sp. TaxID=2706531 RepID=UPI002D800ABD|nr:zf-HC2 domain-containing protein [Segeticoccus sp.]HET8601639.1 zf-HC2 domain-containing protein [Segeticoccus sp.]